MYSEKRMLYVEWNYFRSHSESIAHSVYKPNRPGLDAVFVLSLVRDAPQAESSFWVP